MTGRGGRVGVKQGERGKPLHSLGCVCQSAWAKNGALVRVAGHQPRLLAWSLSHLWNRVLRVRLSPGHSLLQPLPLVLLIPLSFSHTLTSPSYAVRLLYSILSLLLLPSSPLVSFLFCAPSQTPPPTHLFLLSGSLSSFSCSLSLSLSVYLYLSLPPLSPPSPNRSPLCPEALRVAAGIYSSPPPKHSPSLAGLATARPLSHPITPASTVTAKPSASAAPNPPRVSGQLQSGAEVTKYSLPTQRDFPLPAGLTGWGGSGEWGQGD